MLAAVIFVLAAVLGAVQIGSDAIFSSAAAAHSLPARLPPALGAKVYGAIARVAPAPYVNAMLERAAFDRGDLAQAQYYALRLPPSTRRDDLLGRIALARGDTPAAQHYFILADDIYAIGDRVNALARGSFPQAYALELRLKNRLERTTTHPDALAEAHWRLGKLAGGQGHSAQAIAEFRQAVQISPLSERYLLSAGFETYSFVGPAQAAKYFERAISADPTSADAYAGAGLSALRLGDVAAARAYAKRAQALDPNSAPVKTLQAQLR